MKIYLTDGTPYGFYTAAFFAPEGEDLISSQKNVQLTLGCEIVCVETDREKAERVLARLRRCDPFAEEEISLILRSKDGRRERTALDYLAKILDRRAPVRAQLSDPAVLAARDFVRRVRGEAHRFTGFLRFTEGENGVFYAPFEPDNDVLELILPHFAERLKNQAFIIHDVKRKKAALYNGRERAIVCTDEKVSVSLSCREQDFQALWAEYYRSANIAERPHEKQMKGYMPVRYWKYMPEKNRDL